MWPYSRGDVVELVEAGRARTNLSPGMRGTIHRIDPNGVLWVDWASGGLLPMIPAVDVVVDIREWQLR